MKIKTNIDNPIIKALRDSEVNSSRERAFSDGSGSVGSIDKTLM